MHWILVLPYALILLVSAIIAASVSTIAWSRCDTGSCKAFSLGMAFIYLWNFAGALEASVIEPGIKIFLSQIAYIGIVNTPPTMLVFILLYTRRVKRLRLRLAVLLWIAPIIVLLLTWSNAWHGLVWPGFKYGSRELNILIYEHGPGFWTLMAFTNLYDLIIAVILLRELRHSQGRYRSQVIVMLIGASIPAFAGVLYAFGVNLAPGLDLVSISSVLSGVMFAIGIFRFDILNLVPIARAVLLEQLQDGIVVLDTGMCIIDLNFSAKIILNDDKGPLLNQKLATFLSSDKEFELLSEQPGDKILEYTTRHNPPRWIELRLSTLYTQPGEQAGWLCILRDITRFKDIERDLQQANQALQNHLDEISRLQAELREQAIRDPLTGCFNRRYLNETLQQEFSRARRKAYLLGVIMLDIDHFKQFNDHYGHEAGDKMLQKVSEVLFQNTRLGDIVCRYGGEEFLLVLYNIDLADLLQRAEDLRLAIETSNLKLDGDKIQITASLGVALYPHDGDEKTIIRAADQALYAAKAAGRNHVSVYRPDTLWRR